MLSKLPENATYLQAMHPMYGKFSHFLVKFLDVDICYTLKTTNIFHSTKVFSQIVIFMLIQTKTSENTSIIQMKTASKRVKRDFRRGPDIQTVSWRF